MACARSMALWLVVTDWQPLFTQAQSMAHTLGAIVSHRTSLDGQTPMTDRNAEKIVISILCGLLALAVAWRCAARPVTTPRPVATPKARTRNVGVQSPVTYKRHMRPARLQPLGEHDWGAWREGQD